MNLIFNNSSGATSVKVVVFCAFFLMHFALLLFLLGFFFLFTHRIFFFRFGLVSFLSLSS